MNDKILPWQQSIWQQLQQRSNNRTLPHALLFTGLAGLGKSQFTRQFIQSLLCDGSSEDRGDKGLGCGRCKPCSLYAANTHPDVYWIGLEENSKQIKIDQIRALTEKLGLKSQQGGYRAAVINPADRLNTAAANSLLKTLEEPGENTLLILITDRPGQLPATIRSRCQIQTFASPPRKAALEWLHQELDSLPSQPDAELLLALSGGAPLKAVTLDKDQLAQRKELLTELSAIYQGQIDPIATAGKWFKNDLENCLDWITSWVVDIIQLRFTQNPPNLRNPDLLDNLQVMAEKLDLIWLYSFQDKLKQAGRLAETSINRQLLLEDLLIMWSHAGSSSFSLAMEG